MKVALFIILINISNALSQEALKHYKPTSIFMPDLSKKTANEIARQTELLSKEHLTVSEKKEIDILLNEYGEEVESVWDIIGNGCSWYCGGGNYNIISSSKLKSQNKNNIHSAKSANDLSYKTAWLAGRHDNGIGEFIEYHFKNESPRVTSIIISNGYQKSELEWQDNNRVKSLILYVNEIEYGILNLEDSKTDQKFQIGTFGQNPDGTDLILRFEILDIYKGDKYSNTAITEIYFDGIDVH